MRQRTPQLGTHWYIDEASFKDYLVLRDILRPPVGH